MKRISGAALALAALALAACDVSYRTETGNGAVRADGNGVSGTLDADVNVGGVRADIDDGRGEVSVGGATVNMGDGRMRADFRTDENRTVSITTNRH